MILYALMVALLIPAVIVIYRYITECGKIKKRLKVLGVSPKEFAFPKGLKLSELEDMLYEKETEMAERYFINGL
jgi:hypothetical protein